MTNDFSKLSAEDEMSRLAQVTPEELAPAEVAEPVRSRPVTPSYSEMDFCPACREVHSGRCRSEEERFQAQFTEWRGDSDGTVGVD